MHFLPENFPPIDTNYPYCVYLTSATNIRILYDLQNDNRYHSYMDYTIVGDTAIRSSMGGSYTENNDMYNRICLQGKNSTGYVYPDKLDSVLLGRYSEYRDFWFPILSVLAIVLIFGFIYKIMFKRFIK